jgi:hypothetical protein
MVAPEPRPFRLLFPALYYEYKNVGTLLEAMKLLLHEHKLDVELLTTADPSSVLGQGASTAAADRERARDPALASRIRFIGAAHTKDGGALCCLRPLRLSSGGIVRAAAHRGILRFAGSRFHIPVNRELAGDAPLISSRSTPRNWPAGRG